MRRFLTILFLLFVARESSAQGPVQNFLGSITFVTPQHIVCDSGCGTPASTADNTAFVVNTTNTSLIGAAFAESLADLTSPVYGAVRMTKQRALQVNLRDSSGTEIGSVANPVTINCNTGCGSSASVLMADTVANPTIPQSASFGTFFNGVTWDRVRGDTTNGMWANLKATVGLKPADTLTAVTTLGTITNSVAVTGTFWPVTAAAPSSVRLSDGAAFYNGLKAADTLTKLTTLDTITNPVAVTGTFWPTTAAAPSSNRLSDGAAFYNALKSTDTLTKVSTVDTITNTVPANITQFGSVAISTGTGASGTGIPRVTIANDSSLAANQSVNVAQFGGSAVVTGVGSSGAGIPRVTLSSDSTASTQIFSKTIDTGSEPATVASAAQIQVSSDREGNVFTLPYGPNIFHCGLAAVAASLVKCGALATPTTPRRYYITTIIVVTSTTTAGTWNIQTGTVTNCGTGTAALFPISGTGNKFTAPISTAQPQQLDFHTPIQAPSATDICVLGVATNTINIEIFGYIGP